MADYLDALARFAAETRFASLPATTVTAAKHALLDTLGAILAGSALPENRRLAELAAARAPGGQATLLGQPGRTDAFWAALANATAGVALEVDEGNRLGGGHPAIHVVPGALAVAEERGIDGPGLLESVVVGYEVSSRLGAATTQRANVHSHGTWGTIGTAVAVAKLEGAPAATVRAVMNLAASMSPANSWTPALEGATIRNLYPGRSAFQGVLAVELQRCGFSGLPDAPSDVYATILGDRFEAALAIDRLAELGRGERFRIEQNYFKLHACCRFNHFALDALLGLLRDEPFHAEDVLRLRVTTIPFAVRMASGEPRSTLGAKFSIPYAVAAAIVLGRTDHAAFEPPALSDPRIRALARKIEVQPDPEMSPRAVDRPTAHVKLALRDGRILERTATVPRGDAVDPLSPQELAAKFLALASPVLGAARASAVVDTLRDLEAVKDVRELAALLGG